jgi:hypothetical protein
MYSEGLNIQRLRGDLSVIEPGNASASKHKNRAGLILLYANDSIIKETISTCVGYELAGTIDRHAAILSTGP